MSKIRPIKRVTDDIPVKREFPIKAVKSSVAHV